MRWHRLAPGSYEARHGDTTLRVYRNCDCGHCPAWVATITDADGYETERYESITGYAAAKDVALTLAGVR